MNRVRNIGNGGCGVVDLYIDSNKNQFAVKQMIFGWNGKMLDRFIQEIELMKNLAHKNIVRILRHNYNNDKPFYVMPFYKDGSLRDRLQNMKSQGLRYSESAASGLIYYLTDALSYAHSKNAIHRDLKPENILFDGNNPMIADWGIGKFIHKDSTVITSPGIGTPLYCAPEQWEFGKSSNRSDIYSLGVIYQELVTGSTHGEIENDSIKQVINKMTMRNPNDRYQNMDEVKAAIINLGIVKISDPLEDFLKGAFVVLGVVGIAILLSKLFD